MRVSTTPSSYAARGPLAVGLLGAALLVLAACGTARPTTGPFAAGPAAVTAMWTGDTLTLAEFEHAYATTVGSWDAAADDSMPALTDFLERYVNFRLKVKEARSLGLQQDSALQAEVASYREQLARPYYLDQNVLDDIVRDLYVKQQEEVRASHLLIRVDPDVPPADSQAAYARTMALRDSILAQGGTPEVFEAIARRHSEDPSVARNAGDLGYFTGGRMVHQFENAAYANPPGTVSMPVRTRFGYHLIYTRDRRPRSAEIRAAHILIRPQGATVEDTLTARTTLEGIRERVLAGEDFATLARQYSDDVASGRNGGDLGFFGLGRMVPAFEVAAFALDNPGDVSEVVPSRFGFHLIQLTERRTLPTFEEAYPELKRLAAELPLADERAQALGAQLRAESNDTFDEGALRAAMGRLPADSLLNVIRTSGFGADDATAFATVGGQNVTLGEFAENLQRTGPQPGPNQPEQIVAEARRWLNSRAIDNAVGTLEQRDPEFRRMLAQYEDGVLLFKISEDTIWTQAANDDAALRRFHAEHAAEYRFPQRNRVLAFGSPSDSLLTRVIADLDAGRTPQQILDAYRDSPLTLRLDTIYVADSTSSPLDLTIGMTPGQHTDIQPERSRLAVYRLDAIEEPRQKTFEEARAEVVSAYQDELERQWVARLRERYHAHTYPEVLPQAFQGDRPAWARPHTLTGGTQ
ncbi:MAG TPA: peptidylprolyl isomerase [Rhodothermales bacterium]|nr:peptidylprolyl isomerase [Rhodothermales bacterium]